MDYIRPFAFEYKGVYHAELGDEATKLNTEALDSIRKSYEQWKPKGRTQ